MGHWRLRASLAAAGLTWTAITAAQGAVKQAPTASCPENAGSAIAEVSCEILAQLGPVPKGSLVVGAPLASDAPTQDADGLARRVAQVVAGRLQAEASPRLASLAQARGLAATRGWLVLVEPQLQNGRLRVVAQLHAVARGFWDRVREGNPGPSRHAFAERRIDLELRSFLPPVPLVAKRIDRIQTGEPNPVAIACGDTDGQGSQQLVVVGRHRVRIGRARSGKLAESNSFAWADLSVLSRSPLREPIAGAVVRRAGLLDIGLSDRLDAVRLDATGRIVARLGRSIPWGGGGCGHVLGISVEPVIGKCAPADPVPQASQAPANLDALAGAFVASKDGTRRVVRAGRRANTNTVDLFDDAGRRTQAKGIGAQLAVADLDGDGEPELLGSADTLEAAADALVVRTWRADGSVQERFRVAVTTGVSAIGVCEAEGTAGMRPIVVASAGEAWIIR